MKQAISASLEDYLEAILNLARKGDEVHVKDIAKSLGVTMPSVTGALRTLAERGLVKHLPYGTVALMRSGRRIGERVRNWHDVFTAFFVEILGIDEELAEDNACRIEHAVDPIVLERMAAYLDAARRGRGGSAE